MAAKNDSKKTTKTAKAKKGDASPAKNSKKPKAPKAAAPETTKVPEPVSPPPVTAPAATEGDEPWQALVIYDAGMGTVPVTSGECCGTPLAAVASLREDLEPNHNDDTEDDCEFDHV